MTAVTSALVLIDLMPRIVAMPLAPHSGADVVERCQRLAAAFRAKSQPVVAVRVERPGLAEQPPGSDLVDNLVEDGDLVIVKRAISAFHNTDLHAQLQARGVRTIVLTGLVTTIGVAGTAYSACDNGYGVEFVGDAMSAVDAAEHDFAITRLFPRIGTVNTTDDYLAPGR